MKKHDITVQELKASLKLQGISVRPSYHHKDYMFTSFTMPYPLKNKLNRISKQAGLSRSKVVQLLLEQVDENKLLESLGLL